MQDPSTCDVRETGRAGTEGAATVQSLRVDDPAKTAAPWSDDPTTAGTWGEKDGSWEDGDDDPPPPTLETGHALLARATTA
jgi:hypothetical protein